ncbi:MAG: hypothetical protein IT453_15455 [Planctomycetes bacterium]|nr:hypothetical protein [Planctomycetota bacterium]
MRRWQLWIVAWLVTFTGSCIEVVRWKQQDVYLKYDAAADTAEMLLVYDKVFAGKRGDEALARATHAVEAIAAGSRYFVIADWPLEFELDGDVRGEDSKLLDALAKRAPEPGSPEELGLEFLAGIEVRHASLHLSPDRGLAIVQHVRLPRFSLAVRAVNAALSREYAAQEDPTGDFTPEEWSAWREYARSGKPWLAVTESGFEFRAPYGGHWLAALMKYCAESRHDEGFTPGVAGALTELAVEDGEAIFRWRTDDTGAVHFRFPMPDAKKELDENSLALAIAASTVKLERDESAHARVLRFLR